MTTPHAAARQLCDFIDASPTPFHAVAGLAERLRAAGFVAFDERERWAVEPGTAGYVIRDGGSIIAFRVGSAPMADAGFRIAGAHTDSPTYRLRPHADVTRSGYQQLAVEVYGGPLHYTWLDRDLTVAGRVVDAEGTIHLVHLPGAPLRIPSLAIHLNRTVNDEGLKLNPQHHMLPMWSALLEQEAADTGLIDAVTAHVGATELLTWDLVLADTQPSALGGRDEQFVFAPRQDNLVSCHAAVNAIIAAGQAAATQVVVCNDHEEVGSGSAEGARGAMLEDTLSRLIVASGDTDPQARPRAFASTVLVSADSAHALHPNYADKHDPGHQPRLGGGPVLKVHANQAYATDAGTAAWFLNRCREADVPVQAFTNRADSPSGSTIGPLTATRLGIHTVDIGNPLLSMHSVREQSSVADLGYLTAALTSHMAS